MRWQQDCCKAALMAAVLSLAGCASDQGGAGAEVASAPPPPDTYLACLDERGVDYRYEEDGTQGRLEIIDQDDPNTASSVQACIAAEQEATESDAGYGEEANRQAEQIIDCLQERGWDLRVETGTITYGDGTPGISWYVSDDIQQDADYQADSAACSELAGVPG